MLALGAFWSLESAAKCLHYDHKWSLETLHKYYKKYKICYTLIMGASNSRGSNSHDRRAALKASMVQESSEDLQRTNSEVFWIATILIQKIYYYLVPFFIYFSFCESIHSSI